MSQIRLVLADSDGLFLERFGAYLQRNKSNRFSLELLTTVSNLEAWMERSSKTDLLVISASLFLELNREVQGIPTVLLSDCPESFLPSGYPILQKYKSAEILMNDILSLCSEKLPETAGGVKGRTSEISLVLYADGSDALNPMAPTIACIKAQEGKSVFYLSLDELPDTSAYFSSSNDKGLSEMIYYIKARKENLTLKAEACMSKDLATGVSFMNGHKHPDDIGKLTGQELEVLIHAIEGTGSFSDLIISRAFRYDQLLLELLKMASKIYIAALNYGSSTVRIYKAAELLMQLESENGLALKNRSTCFIQEDDRTRYTQMQALPDLPLVQLPYPIETGSEFFPPSSSYIAALRAALN